MFHAHMHIVFAIVSSLSTCYSQLIHMPGYGQLRPIRRANGCRHVFTQVCKVPDIGQCFVRVFDYLAG